MGYKKKSPVSVSTGMYLKAGTQCLTVFDENKCVASATIKIQFEGLVSTKKMELVPANWSKGI